MNGRNFIYRVRFCYEYTGGEDVSGYIPRGQTSCPAERRNTSAARPGQTRSLTRRMIWGLYRIRSGKYVRGNHPRGNLPSWRLCCIRPIREIQCRRIRRSFSDTQNPRVSQAYRLGLVQGVGGNRFNPVACLTREQMAAVMVRTLKAMTPTGIIP